MIKLESGEAVLNKVLITICVLMINYSFAQDSAPTEFKPNIQHNDILNRFNALEKSTMKDFLIEMEKVNKISSDYIREREEECSGVYSTITTNEKGEKSEQKKKLSKKET